ncbi:globin domain-containing protein [Blastococcus sp. CT_GayMR16]|uniref:globin domain-containing protein n=1 Tax=Blastococcus sp. CT_GayMR16 TaxID=2559607 RepID=UPI00107437C7|nr:globin domain-containing protein [Blastococcus sp. CT_GayMR16]TFV86975.1 oxidoreductase [Blastococcus sp. CT_GayMR16]
MDIPAMRANFAKSAATGDEAPLYFYSHLFLSHPETRQLFPVSMAHQRDRLFSALGDVVARVDDLDALVPILQQLGRDHRKFGTVAAHYPAVGASLLATLEHFDDEWTPELAKDWTEAYTLVAEVMVAAADEAAEQPAWWEADVVAHERRTIDVAVLQVRPRARYDYLAGQSVSLETDLRPRLWRYYSPANAPRPDGLLEIHVKARDGGPVSSALVRRTGVGDVLRLGPPVGHLALDGESDRDLLLVAGGMGLAPLKALIDQVARKGPARRVDLFVGNRTEDQIYDRADLQRLQHDNPWLTVTYAVSEDKISSLEHGDVGDVVLRHGPWSSREICVAGPAVMVEDTVSRLVQHGVPSERISMEIFAPSRPGPSVDGEVTE